MSKRFTEVEKRIIGIICCFKIDELEYKNDPSKTLHHFYDDRGNKLCSRRTWNRIANGEKTKRSGVYEQLLKRCGVNFIYDETIEEKLDILLEGLLTALEMCEDEYVLASCNSIIELLDSLKESLYYGVCYQTMQDIKDCYVHGVVIDEQQFKYYENIKSCLSPKMQILIQDMLFQYGLYVEITKITKVINNYDFKGNKFVFTKIRYVQYLIFDNQLLDAHYFLLELKELCKINKNYTRLLEIYNIMINIALTMDKKSVDKLEADSLRLVEKYTDKLSKKRLASMYYMYAMRKYISMKYNESRDFFIKAIQFGNIKRERECNIFIVHLNKLLSEKNIYKNFNDQLKYQDRSIATLTYQYFIMEKDGCDALILENYILTKIIRKISNIDKPYIELFLDETMRLNKITRRYSVLSKFNDQLAKIRNNAF